MSKRKRDKEFKTKLTNVELYSSESEWDKIPARIRTLIKNRELIRISNIRDEVSRDAGLPMPIIFVCPYCWVSPDYIGGIFAKVTPMPYPKINRGYTFAVNISAASLFAVRDDILLRRIICHEFAHCFYYIEQAVLITNFGEKRETINGGINRSEWLNYKDELERDEKYLVSPADWFGQWDVEHFILGDNRELDESNERLKTIWIDRGLPTVIPNRIFEADGSLCIEDEIMEHIRKLNER